MFSVRHMILKPNAISHLIDTAYQLLGMGTMAANHEEPHLVGNYFLADDLEAQIVVYVDYFMRIQ